VIATTAKTTQQGHTLRRLYRTMSRHRELALAVIRPLVLTVIATILIYVMLPAVLAAQAATDR